MPHETHQHSLDLRVREIFHVLKDGSHRKKNPSVATARDCRLRTTFTRQWTEKKERVCLFQCSSSIQKWEDDKLTRGHQSGGSGGILPKLYASSWREKLFFFFHEDVRSSFCCFSSMIPVFSQLLGNDQAGEHKHQQPPPTVIFLKIHLNEPCWRGGSYILLP